MQRRNSVIIKRLENIDTRTFIVAFGGTGALRAIAYLVLHISPSTFSRLAEISLGFTQLPTLIAFALDGAAILVLPCLLAVIAARRPFLWGIVPATILAASWGIAVAGR